jgi:hypothetical protein
VNRSQLSAFCQVSKAHQVIIDTFARRDTIDASYWGRLYSIALEIDEFGSSSSEWEAFYARTILPMKEIIEQGYGGPIPAENASGDDEFLDFPLGRSQLGSSGVATTLPSRSPPRAAATFDEEETPEEDDTEDHIPRK